MSDGPQGTEWEYEEALEKDKEFEAGLPLKEFFVFLLVLVVVAIRLVFG